MECFAGYKTSFRLYVFHTHSFQSENFDPVKYKTSEVFKTKLELPPYNGFGSEEDSVRNCISLIPKPPKRDFIKFMEKDRFEMCISHSQFYVLYCYLVLTRYVSIVY